MFDFKNRRKRMIARIRKQSKSAAVIVFGSEESLRNSDVTYAYRPDSSMMYLTGFAEEKAIMLLRISEGYESFDVFSLKKDVAAEIWTGRRAGLQKVKDMTGADESHALSDFEKKIPKLLKGYENIYFLWDESAKHRQHIFSAIKKCKRLCRHEGIYPTQIHDLTEVIGEMRLIKDKEEIICLKKAAEISVEGHLAAMQFVNQSKNEFELESELTSVFMKKGARRQGYTPIVAAGKNACVLHYVENNAEIKDGDLILIDAGCEYKLYTADITRTFPANGRFTAAQKEIYQIVLDAQKAGIDACKVGSSIKEIDLICRTILAQGLIDLTLLKMDIDTALKKEKDEKGILKSPLQRFYPHGTSHYLGMDVHDIGRAHDGSEVRTFKAGVVLTVEPGIYCQPDDLQIPEKYRGIGIRIEDDILVTEKGPLNLTEALVKEIVDIEALILA